MYNWKAIAIGTVVVAGLYVIGGATLILVINQWYPRGQPVEITQFAFRVPGTGPDTWIMPQTGVTPALVPGGRASAHIEFTKYRHCYPSARLVFLNEEGEEKQFLFPEWPSLEPGHHTKNVAMDVPENLIPGAFQVQARIYYDCQESDHLVQSPTTAVNVIAGNSQ